MATPLGFQGKTDSEVVWHCLSLGHDPGISGRSPSQPLTRADLSSPPFLEILNKIVICECRWSLEGRVGQSDKWHTIVFYLIINHWSITLSWIYRVIRCLTSNRKSWLVLCLVFFIQACHLLTFWKVGFKRGKGRAGGEINILYYLLLIFFLSLVTVFIHISFSVPPHPFQKVWISRFWKESWIQQYLKMQQE